MSARFAAYVAHELRTPLATQRALLELTLADPDADIPIWREVGESVLRACARQERLLEACLTLARSQCGPQRNERLDLAQITEQAVRDHDVSDLERVVVLRPALTIADPGLVERLVANLISNAIRHNVASGRIEVATLTTLEHAVVSVANTGPSIAACDLRRLFEPFQRLGSNPRTFNDGVGLGLAIVRALADAHGATVRAHARAEGGLAIDVAFPAIT